MVSPSVIIIDDDPVVVFMHQLLVKQSELSTDPLVFSNGQAALDYLDSIDHQNRQSLLLLDINMPIMSGWDILEAINARSYAEHVSAIVISSSVDANDHKKAKTYKQVMGYMEKPIRIKELQDFHWSP